MDINQIRAELDEKHKLFDESHEKWESLFATLKELEYGDPERVSVGAELYVLGEELKAHNEAIQTLFTQLEEYSKQYHRPDGLISGFFSRILGPLPDRMKRIEIDQDDLANLPRYRFLPLATLLGVLTVALTMFIFVPWARISPFTLAADTASVSKSTQSNIISAIITTFVFGIVVTILVNRRKIILRTHEAALDEEQWFRSGAENWTFWQRVRSCLAFGSYHVVNIIMPLTTLCALSFGGAVIMLVYLREYRRSGSTERATLVAARFHAVYNMYAFGLMFITTVTIAIPLVVS
jgi:hypothetical protein